MQIMDLAAWVFGFNQREKGSWSGDSLVEGREATWEKKARELGGMLSLNQKNQKKKSRTRKERKKGSMYE